MSEEPHKKTCFVVMGFGEKTDFQQQKTFDLDKSYRIIIKKAVEAAGLECIRADDVMHSGVIDKPMYELLLTADVVVADLSTSNANAIYELGVRHALRPHTTIVIAEKGFKFPFDIGHLLVRTYEHLGSGIDAEEAEEFRDKLSQAIKELGAKSDVDSPVYTFLPDLRKPVVGGGQSMAKAAEMAPPDDQTVSMLMEMFRTARAASNWGGAKMALAQLRGKLPGDPFVLQQLALATYKEKTDDARGALEEAKKILRELKPETSKDPETLGIWGAIHKRLWELDANADALNVSIDSYGRGFHLKDDYYNGINYAFMLDARAAVSAKEDAMADRVWAKRVRLRVIEDCEARLKSEIKDDKGNIDGAETFWIQATMVEALLGSGQKERSESVLQEAVAAAPESWMEGTLKEQLGKLERFLEAAPGASR
jgi:hypothetical protein